VVDASRHQPQIQATNAEDKAVLGLGRWPLGEYRSARKAAARIVARERAMVTRLRPVGVVLHHNAAVMRVYVDRPFAKPSPKPF
jgi:hypothetical protein